MMNPNVQLAEATKIVVGLAPVTPSTSVGRVVNLKQYSKCTVIISLLNGTTVTGSAITLNQCTNVGNGSGKALAFTTAKRNIDAAAGDTLTDFAVASNTFTTDTTNSKQLLYVIEVTEDMLDINNGFRCFNVALATAVNTVASVMYILWPAEYGKANPPSAIIN